MFGFGRSSQPPKQATPAPRVTTSASARPLRLVYDDNGKFAMDPGAVAALNKVKGPIGVVAVCGRARQGKSFILNQLLGRSSGFQVAPSVRPCTKGLWMWSEPVKRTAPDGSVYHLVMLDSEGIDAYDQTNTYSTQIFSLAVLLSSMFVFNQMGGIDEGALDRLSLVTEMTKHIRVKASSSAMTSAAELSQFSPTFLWLLRDFYLDLSEEGRRITPKEYLEQALMPTPGNSKAVAAKNQIRESIKALFPNRDCFTLVRPVHDEKQLRNLDSASMDVLRPEFREGLDDLTQIIFDRTNPKQMDGVNLTGPMLAALTQAYIQALNQGAVPTIATSWQSVAEGECRRAYDTAVEAYNTAFEKATPPEEAPLLAAHTAALDRALSVFQGTAIGSLTVQQPYQAKLKDTLGKKFQDYKKLVLLEAESQCRETLSMMSQRLATAGRDPNASVESVLKVLDRLVSDYERTASGSAKWQHLVKFLHTSGPLRDLFQRSADKATALERQVADLKHRITETETNAKRGAQEAADWHRKFDVEVSERKASEAKAATALERATLEAHRRDGDLAVKEREIRALQVKAESQQKESEALTHKVKDLEAQVTSQEQQLKNALSECKQLRSELERAHSSAGSARSEAEKARAEAERERQEAEQKARVAERARSAAEAHAESAEAQAASAREELKTEVRKPVEECEKLQRDVKRLTEKANQLTEGQEEFRKRKERLEKDIEEEKGQVATLRQELRARLSSEEDMKVDLEKVRKRFEESEKDKEVLRDESTAWQRRAQELQKSKENLENVKIDLESVNAALEGEKGLLEKEKVALDKEVEELREKVEAARKEHREELQALQKYKEEATRAAQPKSGQKRERSFADEDEEMADAAEEAEGSRAKKMKLESGEFEDANADFHHQDMGLHNGEGPPQPTRPRVPAGDHTKMTVVQLKQAITDAGFPHELLKLKKNANKKDHVALYEKIVLNM